MNTQRNATLDIMKLLASYMVVFIHVRFYGHIGIIVEALARFAVPLFFLISGFYSYHIAPGKILKRAKRILFLFVLGMICYNLLKMLQFSLSGDINGMLLFMRDYVDYIIITLQFNKPAHGIYMWFLLASIYVYIVFYIFTVRKINEKVIFPVCVTLLFLHILLGEFGFIFSTRPPVYLVRNFALMGVPFFGFGLLARKLEQKLQNIPDNILVVSIAIGMLETVISRQFWGESQLYVGSLFLLFPIVVTFVKHPNMKHPRIFDKLSGCSTYIYIFHVMVTYALETVYKLFGVHLSVSVCLQMINPILVCIVSTMVAYVLTRAEKVILKK